MLFDEIINTVENKVSNKPSFLFLENVKHIKKIIKWKSI